MILGPTAVGKSALALRLAEERGGEIVNADALQAYRGLDVGTAKPTMEERRRVPHHLLDILDPDEPYSAGEFARRACEVVPEIRGRGRIPIVTGGSGLYVRALTQGLSPLPAVEPAFRARLQALEDRRGLELVRRMLALHDPVLHGRLEPADRQRISRGVEVALASGRPLSWWQRRPPEHPPPGAPVRIGLTLPRPILYDRVAGRVDRMLQRGWVDEVEALLAKGFREEAPAFQAIGYRELARHLRGEWTLHRAREEIVLQTRRFAKRQMTWFRKEPDVTWIRADRIDEAWSRTMDLLDIA